MNTSSRKTCHIVPCSIDQDITAPITQYFHPTQINYQDVAESSNAAGVVILAAQFRGRGLICAADRTDDTSSGETKLSTLPDGMIGLALTQHPIANYDGSTDNVRRLKVVDTFSRLYHWQHEHDVEKLKKPVLEKENDTVGLKAVSGWCEIAHAVHDRIPIELISHDKLKH